MSARLERRGYVARTPDPADARARLVALTERGQAAIEGGRRDRRRGGERLGPRRVNAATRLRNDIVAELGADAAVRGRRVQAPRGAT